MLSLRWATLHRRPGRPAQIQAVPLEPAPEEWEQVELEQVESALAVSASEQVVSAAPTTAVAEARGGTAAAAAIGRGQGASSA